MKALYGAVDRSGLVMSSGLAPIRDDVRSHMLYLAARCAAADVGAKVSDIREGSGELQVEAENLDCAGAERVADEVARRIAHTERRLATHTLALPSVVTVYCVGDHAHITDVEPLEEVVPA